MERALLEVFSRPKEKEGGGQKLLRYLAPKPYVIHHHRFRFVFTRQPVTLDYKL